MTSSGDIYAHNLLESEAKYKLVRDHDDLPLGNVAVAVGDNAKRGFRASRLGNLAVNLCDQYPLPSSALSVFSTEVSFRLSDFPKEVMNFPRKTVESTASVRPYAASHFVVKKGESDHDAEVKPESSLVLPIDSTVLQDSIDDQLLKAIDRYDHGRVAVVRKADEDYRSDVTSSFASMAILAWPAISVDPPDDDVDLLHCFL
jgi:hypothetical protein